MTLLQRILGGEPKITCSECLGRHLQTLVDVPTEGGGAVRQFSCPHCGHVTKVAVFSPYGVELMDKIQEAGARRDVKLVSRLQKKLRPEVRRP